MQSDYTLKEFIRANMFFFQFGLEKSHISESLVDRMVKFGHNIQDFFA